MTSATGLPVVEVRGARKTCSRWRQPPEHAVRGRDLTVDSGGRVARVRPGEPDPQHRCRAGHRVRLLRGAGERHPAINPALQPYLFTTGVTAWVEHSGVTVDGPMVYSRAQGYVMPEQIHVSNLHGAVTLLVHAGVVLAVSVATFRARDIT